MTCKKAQGYLESEGVSVGETQNANKEKIGPEEALKLLDGLHRLVAMKGKKVVEFDLKKNRPEDDELLKEMIGPSGNLRAPTIRKGKVMFVGFNEDAFREHFG